MIPEHAIDLSQVTAAILAGGLGTRLRSVVADRPKGLAVIHARPFLSYLLDQLAAAGCRSVVLCTGHLGEQVEQTFGSRYSAMAIRYSRERQALGTAGALRLALPLLDTDPILVMNGDSYCHADFSAYWNWYETLRPMASLLLTQVENSGRYGSVVVNDHGQILEFREKKIAAGPGLINAGIYILRREVLAALAPDTMLSLEYDVFPRLVGRGLAGFTSKGRFLDIGTPDDFASAAGFFASGSL